MVQKLASGVRQAPVQLDLFSASISSIMRDQEKTGAVMQSMLFIKDKTIMHWNQIDWNPNRGIFYDFLPGNSYSVILSYTREANRLVIDTIQYKEDIPHKIGESIMRIASDPNPEVKILKESNVIEGVMKFCSESGLEIFTNSLLLKTIAGTYGKTTHRGKNRFENFVEIMPLDQSDEKIPVELRRPVEN